MTVAVAKQATPKRMSLGALVKGKQETPFKKVVYGPEGCGKSTYGADAPDPIFLAVEDGTFHLDIARFPKPQSWGEVLEAADELLASEHGFKSLVVDTLDATEPLIWKQIVEGANNPQIKTIQDFGYGKGPAAALEQWRSFLGKLDRLYVERGMNIVLLAHSQVKTFKSPDAALDDFDRYEMKLAPGASALVREWCHAVLFANYEVLTTEKNGKMKGVSTGGRVMHTVHTAAFDAKNRYGLPPKLPLSWPAFETAARAGQSAKKTETLAEIGALIEKAEGKLKTDAQSGLARAGGDPAKLEVLLNYLKQKVS
jgi:hypothetical protein